MAAFLQISGWTLVVVLAATQVATSQRPSNTSICDYYTTALFKNNTATNQEALLISLVNRAIIGNFTHSSTGSLVAVPGILAQGQKYNDTDVNLLPYFNGSLASSNRGGSQGVAINFLDDGGAAPLQQSKPAAGDSSQQYKLVTHLYQYFGILLGCTLYGKGPETSYAGTTSMYQAHKFMALDKYEIGYFIQQVGLSAASYGVAESDVEYVGQTLEQLFGQRCAKKMNIVPNAGMELQSICTASDCPEAADPDCGAYGTVTEPKHVNGSATANSTSAATPSSTKSSGAAPTWALSLPLVWLAATLAQWIVAQ